MKVGNKLVSGSDTYSFTITDDTNVTVFNTATTLLPETGGIGTYFFTYAGITIMLTVVMIGFILRRKYGKEAE